MNHTTPDPAADAAARATAATSFDRPITVQAGAGTGKTTLLIHRLLVWVLDSGWDSTQRATGASSERIASRLMERVLAVTFTEAAAAELAERFVEAVAAAARCELPDGFDRDWLTVDDATLKERAQWLLPQVDRAQISTIHAWCYDLLRRHPYDAGVASELEIVADAQEIEAIAREVVEDHYREAFEQGRDADLFRLGEDKINPRDWVEMARVWVVAGWSPETHLPEDDGIAAFLTDTCAAAAALAAAAPAQLTRLCGKQVAPRVIAVARVTSAMATEDVETALQKLRDTWPSNLAERVSRWSRGTFTGAEGEAVAGCKGTFIEAASGLHSLLSVLSRLDPERWRMRQCVLRSIIEGVEIKLRERGLITFGGLLRDASGLLNVEHAIADRECARIDLLLVDEFQDTDGRQADLIERLALTEPKGPSLIVVGDPKQSIYGWRNADLETYERIRRAIVEAGGDEVVLSRNFRSTSPILAATDHLVGSQMVLDPGFQPRYHGLQPAAQHAEADAAAIEIRRHGETTVAAGTRLESAWIARDLAILHAEGRLEWNQAALLLRGKTHARTLLRALRAEGVPYVMSADTGFHERSEVIDAVAWVRMIADPTDQLALLKVCRSPTVGMPDAALAATWSDLAAVIRGFRNHDDATRDRIGTLLAAAESDLVDVPGLDRIPGWVDYATDRLGRIGALRDNLRALPFADFLEDLRDVTRIEAIEARRPEGEARVANLAKLFDQLVHQVEETGGDTHAVLRVLRRGIIFELPAEEAVSLTPADGAVQVATIHAVKGLEFDHVYLAHLGSGGGRDSNDLQLESAIPAATVVQGIAHPQWALGKARRDKVTEAERLRLLYVALTRARKRLVICMPGETTKGTLASLVDNGLPATGLEVLESPLEAPLAIDPGPHQVGSDEALPNPEWNEVSPPPPFFASWTGRGDSAPGPDSSGTDSGGAERGSKIHRLLAEIQLPGQTISPAWAEADPSTRQFWSEFSETASGRRFMALAEQLRGREVEVLTPGGLLDSAATANYASGTIDLLYQDSDGTWVVADYKTGKTEDVAERVEYYAPQLRYYGRALQQALGLEQAPRLELWFVDLDRIEVVGSGG